MSSQPPDESRAGEPRQTRWPRWRKSMFAGALILLASAIADAALDDLPRAIYIPVFFVGYVFLAYGFFLAMNARREAEKTKKN